LEETFPDKPHSGDEVSILLLAFTFVCGHRVDDEWVVQHGFRRDCVGGDAGEVIVLVDTEYVSKESIVICC
jgi:hypothetical protein